MNKTIKLVSIIVAIFFINFSYSQEKFTINGSVSDAKNNETLLGVSVYIKDLKTGTNTTTDKEFTSECFKSHMANINKLVKEKKLIVAGPMFKNDDNIRGIFILDVKTFEEANLLLENDKAIKEKILKAELYNWYGSAALSEYLESSDKIWKINP